MNHLLKEYGTADDENYIYLDKDGNAKKRGELTVQWDPVPSKRVLVTFKSNNTLSYLRYQITEVMEKYSIFSGLSNLQATSLSINRQLLPEQGLIGDFLTSGDHLSCEISSQDLWLDVKIDAAELGLVIFLEIKIYLKKSVHFLKKTLLDISNQIFMSRQLETTYDESEADIRKLDLVINENILTTDSCSVLETNEVGVECSQVIDEKEEIGNVFSYIDRFVYVKLEKKQKDQVKLPLFDQVECTISDTLMQISSLAPIRNLKVNLQIVKKISNKSNSSKESGSQRFSEKQNCPCCLL